MDIDIPIFNFSKIFVESVRDVMIFCVIISLAIILSLTLTNLSNWVENFDWENLLFQTIFNSITEDDALNAGKATVVCIYGGPTSCVGPTIRVPDYDNVNPIYF